MPDWFDYADIAALGDAIKRRAVSPVEIVQACLERIATRDRERRIFVGMAADAAMAAARHAEMDIGRGMWRGPLHGVPVAVKDLIRTHGLPTTGGSPVFPQRRDDPDATVVTRLKAAGAILIGKLAMTEAAFFAHHRSVTPPENPSGRDHWTGASSSGPAVALAAGLCAGAIGSDTGGSIRIPAACCGVTGLKPTYGRVSCNGTIGLAETLDHIGPLGRSAADVAVLLSAIAGHDPADPASLASPAPDYQTGLGTSVAGVHIGIDENFSTRGVDGPVVAAFHETREVLSRLGAVLRPIVFPPHGEAMRAWRVICAREAWLAHQVPFAAHRSEYGDLLVDFLDTGRTLADQDVAAAHAERKLFGHRIDALLAEVDMVLMPTMPMIVPSLQDIEALVQAGTLDRFNHFTQVFNLTGHPAISFPAGVAPSSLPIGLQLVGRRDGEPDLCRAVDAFRRATDWHLRPAG